MLTRIKQFYKRNVYTINIAIVLTIVTAATLLTFDDIKQVSFYIRFLITLGGLLYYIFFLAYRQFEEVSQPVDGYTKLRWYILASLLLTIITLTPSLVYQGFVAYGIELRWLRNVTALVGSVSFVSQLFFLHLVFTYRAKQ